jgi:hypothetical protein
LSIATDGPSPTFCGRPWPGSFSDRRDASPGSFSDRRDASGLLGFGQRKPPAPNTYRGSAAAECNGAAASDRCVLETFLCPHTVLFKGVISSVRRESAFPRVSYLRARGRGRRRWPGCLFPVLVAGARAGVQSTRPAVRPVAMDPCRHRSDISVREIGLPSGSERLTLRW